MTSLRIALLTYSTKPRGGVVHTLALAEALAARGHDVTVHALARGGDETFYRRVDPRVQLQLTPVTDIEGEALGTRVVRSISLMRTALAATPTYDIVHAQDCITANAAGPGCVRTVHHLDTFSTPELIACHDRALRDPRTHICVSSAVAGELAAGWGLQARVIPNGVDAARFASTTEAERDAWQQQLGRTYLLAVGGIEPRKGTADLVEAMALVRAELPGVPLVIAGGETLFDYRDYRAAVLARAADLEVDLRLLGTVADDRLPALVAGAAAFVFPSTKEGFGLAAMEALAAGVPLVTRELPVLREVFQGAAIFASDPAAFARAMTLGVRGQDPARRAGGIALAQRHTWSAAAAAHEDLYLSLAG